MVVILSLTSNVDDDKGFTYDSDDQDADIQSPTTSRDIKVAPGTATTTATTITTTTTTAASNGSLSIATTNSSVIRSCQNCVCCFVLRRKLMFEKGVQHLLPRELWQGIFHSLYPSQLSRLSMVCKTFYDIIAEMDVWTKWHSRAHPFLGTLDQRLPCLGMSLSKAAMLHLFAESFSICELCVRKCDGTGRTSARLVVMPLPVLASQVHAANSSDAQVIGHNLLSNIQKEDGWKIRLCLACRLRVFAACPEPIPEDVRGGYMIKRELQEIYCLGDKSIRSISHRQGGGRKSGLPTTYSQKDALEQARRIHGGDVGVAAAPRSLTKPMKAMGCRIYKCNQKISALLDNNAQMTFSSEG
ncbi:hypothetical protein EDD21DRAFT_370947 [Dissophora ornata]|nr:hypothetical protein EDD21DRAFT_370947 [Dissophora ornata]